MPRLTKTTTIQTVYGLKCDRCDTLEEERYNGFHIDFTMGYGSLLDGTWIEATVCQDCLVEIVLAEIPDAVFRDRQDGKRSREQILATLARTPS